MPKTVNRPTRARKVARSPLSTVSERRNVWKQARGLWANRQPDPTKELAKLRTGWDRTLPSLDKSSRK